MKIYADNMIQAQGFKLTAEEHANLTAKADRFRKLTSTTEPTTMRVPVVSRYLGEAVIGYLEYQL